MNSAEIRKRFLDFFAKRGHAILPSAPLVPENDPSVLFNTAGMQPLVPYLMGRPHPMGDKLADVQKCVRTTDIDDVGDNRHLTFFEMLGNWSLGSYFKEDAITWSYELLTSKTEGFGLDPKRLYVTVFAGDANAPRDDEAARIWQSVGMPKHRIYFKDASANWWPAVKGKDTWTGPTGPCSEMFYDITEKGLGDMSPAEYDKADDEGTVVEIWNDVFMQFEKKDGVIVAPLAKKNVDTGAGLERICAVLQKKDNVFETDLFQPLLDLMAKADNSIRNKRIIADHLRSSVFLISAGVRPSNTDRGYILRRLIRRTVMATTDKKLDEKRVGVFVDTIVKIYGGAYPELTTNIVTLKQVLNEECAKFAHAINEGLHELNSLILQSPNHTLTGEIAFKLFTSHGLPLELILNLIEVKALSPVNIDSTIKKDFDTLMVKHQQTSRAGAEQKFKGGLADANDPQVVRYHTATHLLHQALHDVLGEGVGQKGSNITRERLRFDFSYGTKMTDDQKKRVEEIVNAKIAAKLPVNQITMPRAEAEKTGARHFFGEKYGEMISIYFIGNNLASAYSKEFCGGPHVANTSELAGPEGTWHFKIQKEEAVSQGVRRIKAVLE